MSKNLMSRRSVLKWLGATATMVATTGTWSLLQSCSAGGASSKPGRLLFYFTGTGNSLHVAKKLSDNPLSIPQVMKKGDNLKFEANEIGIVFPKYGMAPPMVRDFLQVAHLKANYFFAVMTYGNKIKATDATNFARLLADAHQGVKLNYFNGVKMVDNRLQRFDMAQQLKATNNSKIDASIVSIASDIDAHKHFLAKPAQEAGAPHHLHRDHGPIMAQDMFEITDACIGCGICMAVCPRGDYKVVNDMAEAQGRCEQCLACAHACPQLAIVPTEGDENPRARYRNPNVSLREIELANRQEAIVSPTV